MPTACRKTHNQDSPSDSNETQPWTSFIKRLVVRHGGSPSISGSICLHTSGNTGASQCLHEKGHAPVAEIAVIIGFRLDERIERVRHLAIPHNDHTNAAHTGTTAIRRLEIYCCKVFH